jgi:hypothetical protein
MARRRSQLPRKLLLLGAVAAVAWAGWRFGPQWLDRGSVPHGTTEVCRLAPAPGLAERIGRVAVEARRLPPAAGVPAASACEWIFFGGRAIGRVFTPASLAAGGVDLAPADYFRSIATGLEYEFKAAPEVLADLGDEALVAGFGGTDGDRPQVVLRRGDDVLSLEFEGLDRESAVAFARELAGGL